MLYKEPSIFLISSFSLGPGPGWGFPPDQRPAAPRSQPGCRGSDLAALALPQLLTRADLNYMNQVEKALAILAHGRTMNQAVVNKVVSFKSISSI